MQQQNTLSMLNAPPRLWTPQEFEEMMNANKSLGNSLKDKNSFNAISQNIWRDLQKGTSFETPEPSCGEYTEEYYGKNLSDQGVDYPSLIRYLKSINNYETIPFNYTAFKANGVLGSKFDDYGEEHEFYTYPDVPFYYINNENKSTKAVFNCKLNKRDCYINNYPNLQYTIDYKKEKFEISLNFFYQDSKDYQIDITANNFKSQFKYIGIQLSSENYEDIFVVLYAIQLNSMINIAKNSVTTFFVDKLKKTTKATELNILYKKAPDFVLQELHNYFDAETQIEHIRKLFALDDKSMFDDTSKAMIRLLRSIPPKNLYELFRNYAYDLKIIFYTLDGASTAGDDKAKLSNKSNFANLMIAICYNNIFAGYTAKDRGARQIPTFYFGKNYEVENNIHYENDFLKDKYFLKQRLPKTENKVEIIVEEKHTEKFEYPVTVMYDRDEGSDYHPFEPVYYVNMDATDKTPQLVPAIYVKSLAHQQKVGDVIQDVRIGANILALILGVVSLGSASPFIVALGLLDIALATTDLIVISKEKELMETEEGRQFLSRYNEFMLIAGLPTAFILGRALLLQGAKILTKLISKEAKDLIRTFLVKVLLEINIANFTKNTVKVIKAADIYSNIGPLNRVANELEQLGVIFTKGEVTIGHKIQEQIALIYKAEVIVQGTKRDVDKIIISWRKKTGKTLETFIDEVQALKSYENGRVGYVDGLFDSIDVNFKPKGLKPIDIIGRHPIYGNQIRTKFENYEGYFIRNFDTNTKTFTFNHGFIEDLPAWVNDVKIPLVQGKGIPTQAYFTLRQMKLLGIAKNEIKKVKMVTIQNFETMAYIHNTMKAKNFFNISSVDILAAPSNAYAKTVITQAGYEITSGKIVETLKTYKISIAELKNEGFFFPKEYLKKYNFTNNTHLYVNFDIEIIVKPIK